MGQGGGSVGNDSRNAGLGQAPKPTLVKGQEVAFDATGLAQGGLFNGLTFDKSALDEFKSNLTKSLQADVIAKSQLASSGGGRDDPNRSARSAALSDPNVQAYRMYGRLPTAADPFTAGGKMAGMQYGADGNLYGVVNTAADKQAKIKMTGWQWDTSTLPAAQAGQFYDAKIVSDPGGNLLELSDKGRVVGWARQKLQQAVAADSRGTNSARSRLSNSGADARLATSAPAGNGPVTGKPPLLR